MYEYAAHRRGKRLYFLTDKRQYNTRQHIPRACGCHTGITGEIYVEVYSVSGHNCARAFEHNHRACLFEYGLAGGFSVFLDFADRAAENSCGFARVRGYDYRRQTALYNIYIVFKGIYAVCVYYYGHGGVFQHGFRYGGGVMVAAHSAAD